MGFNPPVPQQDSNWEIRVALLLSLLLQVLLIFLGPLRKRSANPTLLSIVWSCYLLADWVADLGLGLILNNMGNIGGGSGGGTASTAGNNSSSPIIFAFWAPFLLLHLGGPDTITAYSLEDNELWRRHLIGLLFELFSACVIFFCSLRGNPLIHATVLMFVVGVIKYGERTYSLYCGSLERFRANILGPPDPGRNYARFMTEFDSKKKAGLDVEIVIPNKNSRSDADSEQVMVTDDKDAAELQAYAFFGIFRRLFVDLILSSKQRRMARSFFLERELKAREAFEIMELELGFIYDMVYTKGPVAHSWRGCVLRAVCSLCLVSALVIFVHVDKQHKVAAVDVSITYALLLGGLALDLVALAMLLLSDRAAVFFLQKSSKCNAPTLLLAMLRWSSKCLRWLKEEVLWRLQPPRHWSREVSQYNLIAHCVGDVTRGTVAVAASKMMGRRLPADSWYIRRQSLGKIRYYTKRYTVKVEKKVGEKVEVVQEERVAVVRQKQAYLPFPLCFIKRKGISRAATADIEESFVLDMFFGGAKDLAHELKEEQEERKKAAAAQKLLKMEQEAKAAAPAPAAGTPDQEATTEEEEEAEKEAMAEKDAIAEVCRRRGDGVVKSHEDDIKRGKATTTDGDGAKSHEDDIERGKGTKEGDARFKVILDSVVKSDFDESLLLWHIATDLCMSRQAGPMLKKTMDMRAIAETLSEYMLYLLIKQPEMLSARTGIWMMRYQDTCEEARRFFGSMAAWKPDHEDARRTLLSVNTSEKPMVVKGDDDSMSVLFDAVILAKALRELHEEVMLDVITGVWAEMVLYAARSCPGSTHVRHLSRGGELITIIWFLMEHMGLGNAYDVNKVVDVPAKLIVHK